MVFIWKLIIKSQTEYEKTQELKKYSQALAIKLLYSNDNLQSKNYKRSSNSFFLSSYPGLPSNANIFCL